MPTDKDTDGVKPELIAEKLAKERLLDVENGLYLVHSASVKYVSLILAGTRDDVDREVLAVASWLHNVGRSDDLHEHEVIGYEETKSLFRNMTSDFYYKVADCILNHCCKRNPETREGRILRDADKIAFIHPTYLDFVKAEFDRQDVPEKFAAFVKGKLGFRKDICLPEAQRLFDEYAAIANSSI